MSPRFTKFQGYGNDYIVFEREQLIEIGDLGNFAKRICNRHYGAGADGIALAERSAGSDADFQVRIFNPDGSEAGMSGNGTRCAASYLFYHQLWTNEERIWERGVGETESSGTCSCAAVVASVINGKTDRRVDVHAPGGVIPIEWRDDDEVVLTGNASVVYSGEWLLK